MMYFYSLFRYGVEDLISTMNVLYATFVMGYLFYLFIFFDESFGLL